MKDLSSYPAFLYGESVFTTCLVKNGQIDLWQEHLNRLVENTLEYYFLDKKFEKVLTDRIKKQVENFSLEDGALRITVTTGARVKLLAPISFEDLEIVLSSRSMTQKNEPLKLKTVFRMQDPILDQLKISSYGKEFYLKKLAFNEGYDDILFVDDKKVYEASTSNIFFIKGEKIITPASGIYKGIIRNIVINQNEVEVRDVWLEELEQFNAAFLTNSLFKCSPVASVNSISFQTSNVSIKGVC